VNMMNDRVAEVRQHLQISQAKFGEKLGITGAAVSRLESGARAVTESTVKLVASAFGVSDTWLRTGAGEMFVRVDPDEELAYLLGALAADGDEFKVKFITAMAKLDDEQWALVEKFVSEMCSGD